MNLFIYYRSVVTTAATDRQKCDRGCGREGRRRKCKAAFLFVATMIAGSDRPLAPTLRQGGEVETPTIAGPDRPLAPTPLQGGEVTTTIAGLDRPRAPFRRQDNKAGAGPFPAPTPRQGGEVTAITDPDRDLAPTLRGGYNRGSEAAMLYHHHCRRRRYHHHYRRRRCRRRRCCRACLLHWAWLEPPTIVTRRPSYPFWHRCCNPAGRHLCRPPATAAALDTRAHNWSAAAGGEP